MLIFAAVQMVTGISSQPMDCLAPLTIEERRQQDAVSASRLKAANLPTLEADEDLLPVDAPVDFKPALVIVSYMLDATGSVANCTIQRPSGIRSLDNASCDLLRTHLRNQGAKQMTKPRKVAINWVPRAVRPERRACNSNGGAIPISGDRWIPSSVFSGLSLQSGSALVALDVGATGQITNCVVRAASMPKIIQDKICTSATRRAVVLPALNHEGQPIATTLSLIVRFIAQ